MNRGNPSSVLVVAPGARLAERLSERLAEGPAACEVHHTTTLQQARWLIERLVPAVIFFDSKVADGGEVRPAVRELSQHAPVVAAVNADGARELSVLVVAGTVECVADGEEFFDLAAALVERRLLGTRRLLERMAEGETEGEESADFGSLLRHELNNPLTGILGNAEMLLNRRQRLPREAVPRLETIADLAVRLRETVRRLSVAWESRQKEQQIG